MSKIIFNTQTTFIKGRSITDNAIFMKEIMHSFNYKEYKEKSFSMKTVITKAFDTLE
jgi:hypothetical protein